MFSNCFEHELGCVKVCLDTFDLNPNLCDSNLESSYYPFNGLQLTTPLIETYCK